MPDWLTHVLVGYALATALSVRHEWLDARFVTLAMAGALLPDTSKLELAVPADAATAAIGVPLDWAVFHTLGGTAVLLVGATLAFPARYRRRAALSLALGACSHHALDLLLTKSPGAPYPVLWPLSTRRVPVLDLTSSADPALVVGASFLAIAAWYGRARAGRYHTHRSAGEPAP